MKESLIVVALFNCVSHLCDCQLLGLRHNQHFTIFIRMRPGKKVERPSSMSNETETRRSRRIDNYHELGVRGRQATTSAVLNIMLMR